MSSKIPSESEIDFVCNGVKSYIQMLDADCWVVSKDVKFEWETRLISGAAGHMLCSGREVTIEAEIEKESGQITITPNLELSTAGRLFEPLVFYLRAVLEQVGHSGRPSPGKALESFYELPDFDDQVKRK